MAKKKKTWLETVVEAQVDPAFQQWLSVMDQHITWFRQAVLHDFHGDPNSIEAVAFAEKRLIEHFVSEEALDNHPNPEQLLDGFARFIGNALVHGLGGQWVNLPLEGYSYESMGYAAVVSTADDGKHTKQLEMIPMMYVAVRRHTGQEFTRIWNESLESMREHGRTPETNTTDLIAEMQQIPRTGLVNLDEYRPSSPDVSAVAFLPPGRTMTQDQARELLEKWVVPDGLVIEENPHSVAAVNPITGQTIGILLNTAGTSENEEIAPWVAELVEENPHRLGPQIVGSTEAVEVYINNDPNQELITPAFICITEDLQDDFGALIRLENDDNAWFTD